MDNASSNVQNDSIGNHMTKLIAISSFGFFGGLAAILNLVLINLQLIGFTKRKACEYILFATALVGFLSSIARCCLYTYAIAQHDDVFCKYCGLLSTIFSCSATMLLSVNMLLCYLSLYYPTIAKKLSNTEGIILCGTLPILSNIACYTPLLSFDAFGWDALGTCTMKAFTRNNGWIVLSGVEFLCCNIINVVLGLSVIWKIRADSRGVQKLFESRVVKETKQVVKLMIVLTLGPIINYGLGFFTRLLPPEMIPSLWIPCISLILNPLFFAMTPVIIIIFVNDYMKNLKRFLKCTVNHVSSVEAVEVDIGMKVESLKHQKNPVT